MTLISDLSEVGNAIDNECCHKLYTHSQLPHVPNKSIFMYMYVCIHV
jgi:hypothetical protein